MRNNKINISNLLKAVIKVIFIPLYLVNFLIPKNKKVWVLGSVVGREYSDNSKYLYEYILNNTNNKAIWLTKNIKVLESLKKENKPCYHFYSLKGIFYALVAKYIVVSYSYDDVSIFCYLFPKKTKLIQLFHATPLKKLEVEKNRSLMNRFFRGTLRFYIGKKFDIVTSASDLVSEKMENYFEVGMEKYIVTGYPRNDRLFRIEENDFLNQIKSKQYFEKIIIYLPTYREYTGKNSNFNLFDNYGFDKEQLDLMLEKYNAIFLVKLHFRDFERTEKVISGLESSKRVYFIKDEQIGADIYPILSLADILITDYSSVYFDFLLLNKPIVFAAFDLNEYKTLDRGFYFNYEEVTPGPKVNNWGEALDALGNILHDKKDEYIEERRRVNNLMNKYQDNKSSERIFNKLTKLQ